MRTVTTPWPIVNQDALYHMRRDTLILQDADACRKAESSAHVDGKIDVRSREAVSSFVHEVSMSELMGRFLMSAQIRQRACVMLDRIGQGIPAGTDRKIAPQKF